jgi:hypothetical protein
MAALITFVQQHWTEAVASIVSLILGGLFGRWRAWKRFSNRSFFDRLTVSLNYVEDGKFKIRTLLERSAMEVFRNAEMTRTVMAACEKKGQGPILALPEKDYWYYLNPVLNVISERFAEGYVRLEAGAGGSEQTYLLFLTCENDEGVAVRQRKVRAMLIREPVLLSTVDVTPEFRNEFQKARWETLRKVRQELATRPETKRIRQVTVCV